MSFNPKGCSHNVAWESYCEKCDAMNLHFELVDLSSDIELVTSHLENHPGIAVQPSTVIDLYRTINRLSLLMQRIHTKP